jgi:hypothetical protein
VLRAVSLFSFFLGFRLGFLFWFDFGFFFFRVSLYDFDVLLMRRFSSVVNWNFKPFRFGFVQACFLKLFWAEAFAAARVAAWLDDLGFYVMHFTVLLWRLYVCSVVLFLLLCLSCVGLGLFCLRLLGF